MNDDQQGPGGLDDQQSAVPGAVPGQPAPYDQAGATAQPSGEPIASGPPAVYGEPAGSGQPMPYGANASVPKPGTDGMSIAALVTGILGMGVVPIILGILGLKRTKANGTSGRGFSVAGIVLGAVGIVAGIAVAIGVFALASDPAVVTSLSKAVASQAAVADSAATPSSAPETATPGVAAMADDAVPQVAGFTTQGLVTDDASVAAGAVEAYRLKYSNATGSVDAAFTDWPDAAKAQAWAATQDAKFTPDQLVDSSGAATDSEQYRGYVVDGVTTVVVVSSTTAFALSGPAEVITALSAGFSG